MKKYILFPAALLCSVNAYADRIVPDDVSKRINTDTLLFAGGIVVFIVVVRKLYEARKRLDDKRKGAGANLKKDNVYTPKYWYQCKHCRLTVRKESAPKSAECYHAPDHLWTELAEVGSIKYLCKNCNTLIETRTVPVADNCPQSEVHRWEKIG